LNAIKSEDKYLHILAVYNRRIGLPSILISSIIASMLLGIYTYFGIKLYNEPLGIITISLLVIVFVDSFLILFNLFAMNSLFQNILKKYYRQGLPYASLVGIEAINDSFLREARFALLLCASSTASLVMFFLGSSSPEIIFAYLSMGSALITFGFSVIKREHVLDPDEMLKLYEPDIFPMVMTTDILLETFIDPFNRLKFREYLSELSGYLKNGLAVGDALSKITLLLFQNLYGALGVDDLRNEVSELFQEKENVVKIEMHRTFGFDRLRIILEKTKKLIPEFTRLLDRLFVKILDDLPELKKNDLYIDAEVSPEKTKGQIGKCFIFLYNNQASKSHTLSVSYSSGSITPATAEVTLTLPVRDFELPNADSLPVYDRTQSDSSNYFRENDIVGLMSRFMENTRIVWFSFEVRENGLKPIVITVKDKETGQMLFGRTFLIEAANNLPELLLKALGVASVFIGVFLPIARLLKLPV
jgi:hypothetical protein